ncbi:unnamed protein product [Acanthosepion pharaonis]|uniref:PiggyBac transposable element-derived protein domain-containing protein n=1 Tax=Acanthosepion pharaonis TaxID=158019 RepID=A0A812EMX1_ACAPH|nr:unnamed protein product [Sepia pharaonis]
MAAPMKRAAWLSAEGVLAEIFADDDSESDQFSENSDSDDPEYVRKDGNGHESETDGNISDDLSNHVDVDVNVHHGQGDGQPVGVGAASVVNNAMLAAPGGPVAMSAAPAVHRPGPADPGNAPQLAPACGRRNQDRRNQNHVGYWTNIDRLPHVHQFTGIPGINMQPNDPGCCLHWLKMFLTDDLVNIIVLETNRYAQQYFQEHPNLKQYSCCCRWKDLTTENFWPFMALLFNTGIVKKPEIQMYWSTDQKVATPFYSETMARDKFLLILKFLLYKIRPVYDYIINRFKAVYTPEEKLSLDEGMLKWDYLCEILGL